MQQWEYRGLDAIKTYLESEERGAFGRKGQLRWIVKVARSAKEEQVLLEDYLRELGEEGWEMVAVLDLTVPGLEKREFHFKRPVA
ncbi:MAG: hypothetical protein QOF51_4040 [Chloroflexota bacterium]|nr:hypothetical protein [Chloroflexota bacterium]